MFTKLPHHYTHVVIYSKYQTCIQQINICICFQLLITFCSITNDHFQYDDKITNSH